MHREWNALLARIALMTSREASSSWMMATQINAGINVSKAWLTSSALSMSASATMPRSPWRDESVANEPIRSVSNELAGAPISNRDNVGRVVLAEEVPLLRTKRARVRSALRVARPMGLALPGAGSFAARRPDSRGKGVNGYPWAAIVAIPQAGSVNVNQQKKRTTVRPKKPEWFYEYRDEAVGPVDEPGLRRAAREGHLTRDTLVWRKDIEHWQPIAAVPAVLAILEQEAGKAATSASASEPAPHVASLALSARSDLPPDESWDALESDEAVTDVQASPPATDTQASPPVTRKAPKPEVVSPRPPPVFEVPRPARFAAVRAGADTVGTSPRRTTPTVGRPLRSNPPPKPRMPEPEPRPPESQHPLGDAVSEDEESERPIVDAHVREVLERAKPPKPSRPAVNFASTGSTPSLRPGAASTRVSAASGRAPGTVSASPRPRAAFREAKPKVPVPARPLPLWAKIIGVVALFSLGMGVVLLFGRPHSAAETPPVVAGDPSVRERTPAAPDEPARVAATAQSTAAGGAVRPAAPAPVSGAVPAASGAAPSIGLGRPTEATGGPTIVVQEGPLPASLFQRLLDDARPMFDQQCWQRLRATEGEVAQNPSLDIELGVSAWGQIVKLTAAEVPVGYRGVGRCIVGRIRGWKFPHAKASTSVTLRVTPMGQ